SARRAAAPRASARAAARPPAAAGEEDRLWQMTVPSILARSTPDAELRYALTAIVDNGKRMRASALLAGRLELGGDVLGVLTREGCTATRHAESSSEQPTGVGAPAPGARGVRAQDCRRRPESDS